MTIQLWPFCVAHRARHPHIPECPESEATGSTTTVAVPKFRWKGPTANPNSRATKICGSSSAAKIHCAVCAQDASDCSTCLFCRLQRLTTYELDTQYSTGVQMFTILTTERLSPLFCASVQDRGRQEREHTATGKETTREAKSAMRREKKSRV